MSDIRVYPHFYVAVELIRETLSEHTPLETKRLEKILEELHSLNKKIADALKDPKSYDPTTLQKLQSEVLLLVGKAENRQVHADLYQLTNSAVDLWLKRPVSSEEQNATLRELKSRMEYLTHHHRFTKEDQKCITLFHKCVLDVEKGIPPSPIKRKTYPKATAAEIISIEEIKRKHLEDPLGLSEILYPMAEMVYRGDYSSFLSAYEALSPHSKKDLATHIDLCGGDLDQLKTEPPLSRNKKHEVKIAQGVLGYANAVMENKEEGILYPSFLTIHQMMLEISELHQET